MTKMLCLHPSKDYIYNLELVRKKLLETKDKIFLHGINLLSCSLWKEWMQRFEDGEEYEFSTDDLLESGDKNALLIVEVMTYLNEVVDELDDINNK
ncbi:hypothetical protein ACFLU5_13485 [Bacteroidota bacterium]